MINSFNSEKYDVNKSLKVENLSSDDYLEICKRLGRKPNRTELGMFGVMWSEHCCYRNSKPLLSKFPIQGKNVLVGPGENAGVIDVGNDQKLVFKIESHNHPSAIEPFQGAATGVGGILRDSTNTVCTIRLSSGTNNVTYKITSQITDSTGLVSERVAKLRIKEN